MVSDNFNIDRAEAKGKRGDEWVNYVFFKNFTGGEPIMVKRPKCKSSDLHGIYPLRMKLSTMHKH